MNKIYHFLALLLFVPFSGYSQQKVTMNFDSVADFSSQFFPWRVVDVDSGNTYGFTNFGFPNNTFPMAFIAFNPWMTTPPMDTVPAILPHSGSKFGASFASTTPPNDDWFISPAVHLKYDGQFSLWVKSFTGDFGLEKYRIAVSVTDSNPSSFTFISGQTPLEAPINWTSKTFSLSSYNNQKVFIAVQCVSNDAFVFMIDDLEIYIGADTPALPSSIFEDFEEMTDFSKDLSPWSIADINGGVTYGIELHTFPHSGEPMAWIVFNPLKVTPPMTTPGIQPHSGQKFAGCFASIPNNNPNNKWLISPKLQLGSTPKIGLWAETFNPEYGLEKYNICVSTKTNNPGDFVIVSGSAPIEAPMDWGYKVVDLSAYRDSIVYLAIQCVSDNTFLLMIDDIEIGSSVGVEDKYVVVPVTVSPNPASDETSLIFSSSSARPQSIDVLDMTGKVIFSFRNIDRNSTSVKLSLPVLPDGMYYLSVNCENTVFVKKLMIKK